MENLFFMKPTLKLVLFVSCLFFLFGKMRAQVSPITSAYPIYKNIDREKSVEVRIESEQSFYMGSSPYVLHVGERYYQRYKHSKKGSTSVLTFIIPEQDYALWKEESEMTLVYGFIAQNVTAASEKRTYIGRVFYQGVHKKNGTK